MSYQELMLIDDDPDDQEIFLIALEKVSDSVTCNVFSSADEALQKLIEKKVTTDIIFLDLNMPLMNGQQFLTEIKKIKELRHLPIIIFTTSSNIETAKITKQLGADNFITKPDKFDELVNILASYFADTDSSAVLK